MEAGQVVILARRGGKKKEEERGGKKVYGCDNSVSLNKLEQKTKNLVEMFFSFFSVFIITCREEWMQGNC